MKTAALAALNLVLLAAFVWAIQHYWGFARLLAPWQAVPPLLLAGVALAQMASYSLRATRIYLADARIPRSAWGRCLQLILLNNVLNLLLPARSGEASFPVLLKRYFGVGIAEGTGTLLWLRLLDLNVLGTLALLFLPAALLKLPPPYSLLLPLLCACGPLLIPMLARLLRPRLGSGNAGRLMASLLEGLPKTRRQLAMDMLITWSAWGIKLLALALVFAALAQVPPATALMGVLGGDLSTILPIHSPGGFGTYEAGVMALTASLTPPTALLLAAAVNLHILVLGIALLGGGLAWLAGQAVPQSPPNS